jgi:hypothetical protein
MSNQSLEVIDRFDYYLTADDVRDLAHYGHAIPISKGYTLAYVNTHYPGWSWSQLVNTLKRAGLYAKKEFHGAHITEGFFGALVLAEGDGVAVGDDGSLEHWLKTERLKPGVNRSGRG